MTHTLKREFFSGGALGSQSDASVRDIQEVLRLQGMSQSDIDQYTRDYMTSPGNQFWNNVGGGINNFFEWFDTKVK